MDNKREIQLRIYNGDDLLYYAIGRNEVLLADVTLFPTNGEEKKDYYIEARFNLLEWPEAGQSN